MRAKDCVPAGGAVHASSGEMFGPSQVYRLGMEDPFENAGLFSSNSGAGPLASGCPVGIATPKNMATARARTALSSKGTPASAVQRFQSAHARPIPAAFQAAQA